jgi:methanogen homoaconitase small subunit
MTSEAELSQYAFIEARPEFAKEVRAGDVIIGGPNFGCGSSREYAPQALKLCGVGAIVAPSFARIFYRNALNLGLPLFEADLQGVKDGESVTLDLEACALTIGEARVELPQPPNFVRDVWNSGGLVAFWREYGRFPGEEAIA